MAWNWKQFIVLFTIWIITIIITGSPVGFIISTILFAWGIQKIKKGEKLKEIYISFIVFIVFVLASNFIVRFIAPEVYYYYYYNTTSWKLAKNMELQSFYQALIENLYNSEVIFVCKNETLFRYFLENCSSLLYSEEYNKKALEGCKKNIKIVCEKQILYEVCYENLQEICKDKTLFTLYIVICKEDLNNTCNEISKKFCSDNEIENYCSKLLQKICTINLQNYCKQLEK